ncbi:MAG: TetR/AcrR family transcriptional regulator [Eubacterium sp.]|nr:TetR/AcrR family transcriptional regulator [Eubacterium sp.]
MMNTKDKILGVAKKEFMEKGFKEASMRNIAKELGISATALYRHYKNKEEIFDAVVKPAVDACESFCGSEEEREHEIADCQGVEAMWADKTQIKLMVDMFYANFDEQKLLFFGSEGTKYANYFHETITKVQNSTLKFMREFGPKDGKVKQIDDKEMHLLLSAQYSAMLEMIMHDFTYEEAIHYAETVNVFFREGWRKFLGF